MDVELDFIQNQLSALKKKLNVKQNRLNMYRNFKFQILDLEEYSAKEKSILLELNTLVFEFEMEVRQIETRIKFTEKEIESLARVV